MIIDNYSGRALWVWHAVVAAFQAQSKTNESNTFLKFVALYLSSNQVTFINKVLQIKSPLAESSKNTKMNHCFQRPPKLRALKSVSSYHASHIGSVIFYCSKATIRGQLEKFDALHLIFALQMQNHGSFYC